jgi:hypothetical protein
MPLNAWLHVIVRRQGTEGRDTRRQHIGKCVVIIIIITVAMLLMPIEYAMSSHKPAPAPREARNLHQALALWSIQPSHQGTWTPSLFKKVLYVNID